MRRFIMIPLLAAGLALGACAQKAYPPVSGTSSVSPATGTALPPPDVAPAAGTSSTGASNDGWVSTYPYGTASESSGSGATGSTVSPGGETPTAATASEGGTVTVLSSEDEQGSVQSNASGWQNPDVTPEQHQADIEGCYRYAWSQVERDMRVEQDVGAARTDGDDGLGFTALTTRMNLFDHRNRRTALINDCMESKGYIQG